MTPEQQRIAIAKACGLKCSTCNNTGFYPKWGKAEYKRILAMGVRGPAKEPAIPCDHNGKLPDYLNDLNAMHEAEKVLTDEQLGYYAATLAEMWNGESPLGVDPDGLYDSACRWSLWCLKTLATATAAQRCEAFLRTIGKWDAKAAASGGKQS